ncbi:DUF2238 domain-containing protein [Photobacterium sp. ZSDE20]|uniref:DUF2238 domain-containing protein n=1 Tax=Photobacterium pectinilyticum TaxID=2906793 RepID=A0ABT1N7F4_9GAMM|nr:DUF2238 domain-containing protein [Photobacterium sp. ZSDE20]MCQ1059621.1 DUF2238 domain-containing protein [Photobacterium sp. ZSDE20]MDD1827623.1 DUF2238 domain-containing protein [Photobacterium sp. ZSDE20]
MIQIRNHAIPVTAFTSVTLIIIWSGLDPVFPDVWLAEIIPVVLILAPLLITYRFFQFSNTAYILIAIWMSLHTIGAHYTFAKVPFDWFNELIGSQRNNFDRIAHFSIGLYAFPIAEFMVRKGHCKPIVATLFAFATIMAIAAGYEIIEWWYAALAGGDAGIEFLGSQGDIWDAQKDMLADTLGAITSLVLFHIIKPYQLEIGN